MNIYCELLLLMLITTFVIDFSGFTDAWRGWLSRWLGVQVRADIKPFTCSLCMTHHLCVLYALCVGEFSLAAWCYICLLALMAKPAGQMMIALRDLAEGIVNITNKLIDKLWKE